MGLLLWLGGGAEDVVATRERVLARKGYPKTIRVDQGSESVSRDLDLWAYAEV
jgi:putative transposase